MKTEIITDNQRILDISYALAEGGRVLMVNTILETSGDEFDKDEHYIDLAVSSDAQLRFMLHDILKYYLTELINREDQR